ncbi:MAG: hypothetical protein WKF66_17375 [Pedobacter sp.]
MRYWAITVPKLPAQAMALYPFMLFKTKALQENKSIIRHEQIHFRQQLELLIIFFYPIYLLNYLVNLLRFKNHSKAYFNISFEREAYRFENDLSYSRKRRQFAWTKML